MTITDWSMNVLSSYTAAGNQGDPTFFNGNDRGKSIVIELKRKKA